MKKLKQRNWSMFASGALLLLALWQFWAWRDVDPVAYPLGKSFVSLVLAVFFFATGGDRQ